MKNFVFISPNFPMTYWKFCRELRNNGMRVLGIGDCPYNELLQELRDSLDEYYKVSSLENNDEVFKAVAFFSFKYGKIDWLESNNEYWLMRDAWLRTEFNITTGPKSGDMYKIKYKSAMKEFYAKAGLPTARYHLVEGFEDAAEFAHLVGYPVVVKPDNGVGANNTYKLHDDEELRFFIDTKDDDVYIMEEFVNGYVQTYDAIVDSQGQPLFESGNITPYSLMDIVNNGGDSVYYLVKELPDAIRDAGLRTVEAFGVKSRFIHLEFFVLNEDQEGLGKKGDILGLEVNMRPAGGFTPDMYNYSQETDVYKIWADMVAFDRSTKPVGNHHYCAFFGRRDGRHYKLDDYEVMMKYGPKMVMSGRIPDALSGAMANQMYVANFDTEEEMLAYYADLSATYDEA
ncbi:MAG: carbamoylphosphate synthase large subunit [Candidatus Faecousia sp.]|nr:carbamoylphosphate synthase large subunit [Candidatus Faecousia sp.]